MRVPIRATCPHYILSLLSWFLSENPIKSIGKFFQDRLKFTVHKEQKAFYWHLLRKEVAPPTAYLSTRKDSALDKGWFLGSGERDIGPFS